jgi:hypothetical protein
LKHVETTNQRSCVKKSSKTAVCFVFSMALDRPAVSHEVLAARVLHRVLYNALVVLSYSAIYVP